MQAFIFALRKNLDILMGNIKEINIKSPTYFFNDIINIEDFNPKLLKMHKKSYKNIGIYYIGYIAVKKIDAHENIHSLNPLYLTIEQVDGFIEEKMEIVFDSTDENNKEVLTKYTEIWDRIKNKIEANCDKKGEYKKDFIEIKFNSDDNLPLNEIINFHMLTIVVKSVFKKDGKLYPQGFLDKCLYELCMRF